MRDCSEKTQTEFARDLNRQRSWTAKLEGGKSNITLKDFLTLAKINDIQITMEKKEDVRK